MAFQNLVHLSDPDMILIQEKHQNSKVGRFDLPGYDIHEKSSTEVIGENGLITA